MVSHNSVLHLDEANGDGDHVDGEREAVDPHVPEAAVAHLAAALQGGQCFLS